HTRFSRDWSSDVCSSDLKAYLTSGEGCLSVDRNVPGYVHRYARITITGYDVNTEQEVKLRLKGLPAIVFQHELDHLNGVMFYDRSEERRVGNELRSVMSM